MCIDDAHQDRRFNSQEDTALGYRTQSVLLVPMVAGETTVGVCQVSNKRHAGDLSVFHEEVRY